MSTLTLAHVLAELPDPRSRHGCFHPLPAVLNLVVLRLLMGRKSLSASARLGRTYGTPLAHALGFRRGKTPAKSTLSEILRAIDSAVSLGWGSLANRELLTLRSGRDAGRGGVPGTQGQRSAGVGCVA